MGAVPVPGTPVIPVLTKADKLKQGERGRQLKSIAAALAPMEVNAEDFLWFSAKTREGRARLWARILQYLTAPE